MYLRRTLVRSLLIATLAATPLLVFAQSPPSITELIDILRGNESRFHSARAHVTSDEAAPIRQKVAYDWAFSFDKLYRAGPTDVRFPRAVMIGIYDGHSEQATNYPFGPKDLRYVQSMSHRRPNVTGGISPLSTAFQIAGTWLSEVIGKGRFSVSWSEGTAETRFVRLSGKDESGANTEVELDPRQHYLGVRFKRVEQGEGAEFTETGQVLGFFNVDGIPLPVETRQTTIVLSSGRTHVLFESLIKMTYTDINRVPESLFEHSQLPSGAQEVDADAHTAYKIGEHHERILDQNGNRGTPPEIMIRGLVFVTAITGLLISGALGVARMRRAS